MEWQPIETAPKDGTYVLIYEAPTMASANWRWDDDYGGQVWRTHDFGYFMRPTHWTPLPNPPNVSRETQEPVKSWQSVETAPKDGTYILGCGNSNSGVVVGLVRWRDECWKLPHGSEVEVISWRPISPGHQEEIVSRETQEWD